MVKYGIHHNYLGIIVIIPKKHLDQNERCSIFETNF